MNGTQRMEPVVLFPVLWPENATPPTVAGYVFDALRVHVTYAQAVAEIARRNGGGGHLSVELKPDTWEHTDNGTRYTVTLAVGRWDRTPLELSPDAAHPDKLRAGPTQKSFTAQVLVPNGTPNPDKVSAFVDCNTFHAAALAKLEAGGLDETTGVVLAMDGGAK